MKMMRNQKPKSITLYGKEIKDWSYDTAVKKGILKINCGKWSGNLLVIIKFKISNNYKQDVHILNMLLNIFLYWWFSVRGVT